MLRRVKVIDAVLGTVLAFSGEPPPLSLELLLPKYLKLRHALVCRQKSPNRPYQPNAFSLGLPTATDNQATDRPTDHACEAFKSWETSHFSRKL